jgi:3-hydroxyacyl-CoA dehydrogenase
MKTLGFIGTGGMGSGMAANLMKGGYSLVVNDLRREVTRNLESRGAIFKETAAAQAESFCFASAMERHGSRERRSALGVQSGSESRSRKYLA